eukprot:gnl/TRDRNA2_/TRDRNA2_176009_c0_seq1.p1 gnl/TRDRNA2_/TRDRNA2_176009_c0~~gnl/TRDRNA2_/TRDRNA2_176009_c0_seq1.p1  ORF type:complete len:196 (+),score=49.18 gnl/TRDRNA2_/TRDRNA2_176009_c0_seq1:106-693(+)
MASSLLKLLAVSALVLAVTISVPDNRLRGVHLAAGNRTNVTNAEMVGKGDAAAPAPAGAPGPAPCMPGPCCDEIEARAELEKLKAGEVLEGGYYTDAHTASEGVGSKKYMEKYHEVEALEQKCEYQKADLAKKDDPTYEKDPTLFKHDKMKPIHNVNTTEGQTEPAHTDYGTMKTETKTDMHPDQGPKDFGLHER